MGKPRKESPGTCRPCLRVLMGLAASAHVGRGAEIIYPLHYIRISTQHHHSYYQEAVVSWTQFRAGVPGKFSLT